VSSTNAATQTQTAVVMKSVRTVLSATQPSSVDTDVRTANVDVLPKVRPTRIYGRYVALVVVRWCPALSASAAAASVTALR